MVIRLGKICLGADMASVAQLRLILNEQTFGLFCVMRRMTVETADIVAGVRGLRKVGLRVGLTVAGQTTSTALLP